MDEERPGTGWEMVITASAEVIPGAPKPDVDADEEESAWPPDCTR